MIDQHTDKKVGDRVRLIADHPDIGKAGRRGTVGNGFADLLCVYFDDEPDMGYIEQGREYTVNLCEFVGD